MISKLQKRMRKMVADREAAKRARKAEDAARLELQNVAISSSTTTTTTTPVLPPIKWTKAAGETANKYRHSNGVYSDRHVRRKKQKQREMAKGVTPITMFFSPASTVAEAESTSCCDDEVPEVESQAEEEELPESNETNESVKTPRWTTEEFMALAKKALEELSIFAAPSNNAKSIQNQLGLAHMARYNSVYYYLLGIVEQGLKKVESSEEAARLVFKVKYTKYKARQIRVYAQEYLTCGSISPSAQGKHSKRVSVVDNSDI